MKSWRVILDRFRKERIFFISLVLFSVLLLSSLGVYSLESHRSEGDIRDFGDALWWSLVTVTTVGYGDTVPRSGWGRVLAAATMLSGIFLFSMTTAAIASVFVEKKIREERGLEPVKLKGHVVLCGWNGYAEEVLTGLRKDYAGGRLKVVLVNELHVEDVDVVRQKYDDIQMEFVRGDFVQEHVLRRANVNSAHAVLVLADASGGRPLERADERTILATLAVKGLAPHVRTCAEILDEANRVHLLRAQVDEVIVRGERTGLLLAGAAVAPGVNAVLEGMLSPRSGQRIRRIEIPERYWGRPLQALRQHLQEERGALLLAVLREKRGINLGDILSHDMSAVDRFIQRKFEEARIPLVETGGGYHVMVNPVDDYVIAPHDAAVVLGPEE